GMISMARFGGFFFQAEGGIREWSVTGVQTCALPISAWPDPRRAGAGQAGRVADVPGREPGRRPPAGAEGAGGQAAGGAGRGTDQIGRASWRGRGEDPGVAVAWERKESVSERDSSTAE